MSGFTVGLFFLGADADFIVWIKRCQEAQNGMYVGFHGVSIEKEVNV